MIQPKMSQESYPLSRNHTLNFEFSLFLVLLFFSHVYNNGDPQFTISHATMGHSDALCALHGQCFPVLYMRQCALYYKRALCQMAAQP